MAPEVTSLLILIDTPPCGSSHIVPIRDIIDERSLTALEIRRPLAWLDFSPYSS
jgi:hypothetical protein